MEKLKQFVSENDVIVTGGVSQDKIIEIENSLEVRLCKAMKDYLAEFGLILGFGVEILGCGKNGISSLESETKRFREFGLQDNYLVIRNVDEWIYCLNNNNGEITSWDRSNKNHKLCGTDFEEYIFNELVEAKEDWD